VSAAVHLSVRGLAAGYGRRQAAGSAGRAGRSRTDGRDGGAGASVLAGLDFELGAGECLAIVGRSGCGKSTLLHVLAGLLPPTAGEVLVGGREVAAADWAASGSPGCRSGHAAYMFQQDLLLPWKRVLANAVFAARVAPERQNGNLEERAAAILLEFGLEAAMDALPHQLSGGMRQRVALARTLVLDRGLVLLDEPFGSLDAFTRAEMRRWLLDVMETHPATWVLVTHDVGEAVILGDHVAVLRAHPACLQGWTDVPLSRSERRGLAAVEAAVEAGVEAGEEAGEEAGVGVRCSACGASSGDASGGAVAALEKVAALSARVRGLLGSEGTIQ
jgi:ABC-type nitrate/sulfonate/bicarbonate transport system ATPase subunit